MISNEIQTSPLPPKMKLNYTDVQLVPSETSLYKLYEAKSIVSPNPTHTIRVFDNNSKLAQESYEAAATLFIQELLHLMTIDSNSVLLNTFEISDGGRKIAFAARPYRPINLQIQRTQNTDTTEERKEGPILAREKNENDLNLVKDMISDILLDVKFLSDELGVRDFSTLFAPQSIYRFKDNGTCFLGDWCRTITTQAPTTRGPTNQTETTETVLGWPAFRLGFQDIQNLGLSVMKRVDSKTMSGNLRKLLDRMLIDDWNFEATLEELETHKGPRRRALSRISDLESELQQAIQWKSRYEAEMQKAQDLENELKLWKSLYEDEPEKKRQIQQDLEKKIQQDLEKKKKQQDLFKGLLLLNHKKAK